MKNQSKNQSKEKKDEKKKVEQKKVFTKEDFLKALKKATRPIQPKVSHRKGKSKTSG